MNLWLAFKTFVPSLLRIVALAYVGLVVVLYFSQSRTIFVPSGSVDRTPRAIGLRYETVTLTAQDGTRLQGWFVPPPGSDGIGRGVVLFCHGNGGNISHRLDNLRIFADLNLATFIFDYRGYGNSTGQPSEEGTYMDARAAWDYLTIAREVAADRIVVYGESLGGAIASQLVTTTAHPPAGTILASTFTSARDRASELYPYLPVRWLLRFNYNSIERVPQMRSPLLVIHSPDDEIIPFHHGQALFAAAREPKMLLEIRGDHNEGFLTSEKTYREGIDRFLQELALPTVPT